MKLYTEKVIADWLAVTERRVRQLRDEGVIAERKPGLYELKSSVVRYISYLRKGNGSTNLADERALLTRAKREAADMENELRRGNLHSSEDIERGLKTMCLSMGDGNRNLYDISIDNHVDRLENLSVSKFFDNLSRNVSQASRKTIEYGGLEAPTDWH